MISSIVLEIIGRGKTAAVLNRNQILTYASCGKGFRKDPVKARSGFDLTPAVQNDQLREIKAAIILQPGPAALTDGLVAIQNIILEK